MSTQIGNLVMVVKEHGVEMVEMTQILSQNLNCHRCHYCDWMTTGNESLLSGYANIRNALYLAQMQRDGHTG